jgi:acetyltransferase-like isoleucine patch superfamily enzyme
MKVFIPKILKSLFWQYYLRIKYRKNNIFKKGVILSKDFCCGKHCTIGTNTIIGFGVTLGNEVRVGSDSIIENVKIDNNTFIDGRVIFTGHGQGHISIGKECYIGLNNVLDWSDDISIGNYVHIAGPSTGLWTHSSAQMCMNSIELKNKSKQYRPTSPIVIDNNVYIGGNCTIYPGVTIGHHSIIAPNSAVTKNVEPYTLVGGVPAKMIKNLLSKD